MPSWRCASPATPMCWRPAPSRFMARAACCTRTSMSDAPTSEPEDDPGESLLIEAARAFERGEERQAAELWRERAMPALRERWAPPLAEPVCAGLELVSL